MIFNEIVVVDLDNKIARLVLGTAFAVTCYSMLFSFQSIHTISIAREQYLAECLKNGESEILIPTANVDGYIYDDSVDTPENIKVHLIDWKGWKKIQQQ